MVAFQLFSLVIWSFSVVLLGRMAFSPCLMFSVSCCIPPQPTLSGSLTRSLTLSICLCLLCCGCTASLPVGAAPFSASVPAEVLRYSTLIVGVDSVHEGISGKGLRGFIAEFATEHHMTGYIRLMSATSRSSSTRSYSRSFTLVAEADSRAPLEDLHKTLGELQVRGSTHSSTRGRCWLPCLLFFTIERAAFAPTQDAGWFTHLSGTSVKRRTRGERFFDFSVAPAEHTHTSTVTSMRSPGGDTLSRDSRTLRCEQSARTATSQKRDFSSKQQPGGSSRQQHELASTWPPFRSYPSSNGKSL